MVPDVGSIVRKRYRMSRSLRAAALVLFMIFLVGMISVTATTAYDSASWAGWSFTPSMLARPAAMFSGFAAGAAFLVVFRRPLTAWMLPFPENRCPRCRYSLAKSRGPGCPECGLALPEGFIDPRE